MYIRIHTYKHTYMHACIHTCTLVRGYIYQQASLWPASKVVAEIAEHKYPSKASERERRHHERQHRQFFIILFSVRGNKHLYDLEVKPAKGGGLISVTIDKTPANSLLELGTLDDVAQRFKAQVVGVTIKLVLYEASSYWCMRPQATSIWGLQLLVHEASYTISSKHHTLVA